MDALFSFIIHTFGTTIMDYVVIGSHIEIQVPGGFISVDVLAWDARTTCPARARCTFESRLEGGGYKNENEEFYIAS